jgi:hypothetical protein
LITLTTTIIISSIISIMVSNSNSISIISIINRVVFEFEDYSDKTPSIIPRKSDEIGESRKGVAVYFPPGVYHSSRDGLVDGLRGMTEPIWCLSPPRAPTTSREGGGELLGNS